MSKSAIVSLPNNSSGIVTAFKRRRVMIKYTIDRGSAWEAGIIMLLNDGLTSNMTVHATSVSDVGTTFFTDIVGGKARLLFSTNNSGSSGVIKYKLGTWV